MGTVWRRGGAPSGTRRGHDQEGTTVARHTTVSGMLLLCCMWSVPRCVNAASRYSRMAGVKRPRRRWCEAGEPQRAQALFRTPCRLQRVVSSVNKCCASDAGSHLGHSSSEPTGDNSRVYTAISLRVVLHRCAGGCQWSSICAPQVRAHRGPRRRHVVGTGYIDRERRPRVGADYVSHQVMVRISDVAAHFEHVRACGAEILQPPVDHVYGERHTLSGASAATGAPSPSIPRQRSTENRQVAF